VEVKTQVVATREEAKREPGAGKFVEPVKQQALGLGLGNGMDWGLGQETEQELEAYDTGEVSWVWAEDVLELKP
jgi:hypothetical protein